MAISFGLIYEKTRIKSFLPGEGILSLVCREQATGIPVE
jgi:hypothetical protein